MVLLTNRRAARLFFGPGDALEETDRLRRRRPLRSTSKSGWSQSNYQRSVEQGGLRPPRQRRRPRLRRLQAARRWTACWSACPDELLAEFKGKLHPYLTRADRRARSPSTSRTRRSTTSAPRPRPRSTAHVTQVRARGAGPAGAGRRHRRARRGGHRRGARRAQPGARRDAADRRELPGLRARGLPGRAAAARRRRRGRAGRGHRRAGDREGDRAVRDARWSCATTTTWSRSAASGRCCGSEQSPFLGTGIMGAPMARNLAGAGHEVRAWNRTACEGGGARRDRRRLPRRGGRRRRRRRSRCSPTGRPSRPVMDGVTLADDQVWWQASTVGVEWIDEARRPATFVDGPVMGTREPAEDGQADRAGRPAPGASGSADVFEPVAAKVVDLGDEVGAGTQHEARRQHLGALARREPGGDDRARRGPRRRPARVPRR